MDVRNYIKKLIIDEGTTLKEVAKKVGKDQCNLSAQLGRESVAFNLVIKILDVLGYDFKAVKR